MGRAADPKDLSSTEVRKEINELSVTRGVGNERPLQYGGECTQPLATKEVLVMEIVALFCDSDDFCLQFESAWHQQLVTEGKAAPVPASRGGLSEGMTIVVNFPQSGDRPFKDSFLRFVTPHVAWAFPHLVSSTRFVELMAAALGDFWKRSSPISREQRGG